jgi:FHA domain
MDQQTGKFTISRIDAGTSDIRIEKEAIFIGRLKSSDVFLDHTAVSRVHAGINFLDSTYFLINLSTSNVLTLNGRPLAPQNTDVLSDGDIIQIGPFMIEVAQSKDDLRLNILPQLADKIPTLSPEEFRSKSAVSDRIKPEIDNVLKVFWEKRTRDDKDDWGTRLRPTEKPQPGKAAINWKPTQDLRQPWRFGLFVWAFIIVGALSVFVFMRYPQAYAGKPLANPHVENIENSSIAVMPNGNSCTTCHTPNEPIENACIRCH